MHAEIQSCAARIRAGVFLAVFAFLLTLSLANGASPHAEDTLYWQTNQDRVTADIKSSELLKVLQGIAAATGWQVFVEPETFHTVSAKFKNLPPGEALHLLLGDVNFALLPGPTSGKRLYVFRTSVAHATQPVVPVKPGSSHAKVIPNELIVRLKPGAKIEDLARLLGAKVIGRIDSLNAYRLGFEDEAAANAARKQLADNSDVASVEDNYSIERPTTPAPLASTTVPPPQLQLKQPPDTGKIIVGLVDTAVQPLGNGLDSFLLKQQSAVGDGQPDPSSPSHGTSMAETILRSLQSVTQGQTSVQILPVDVYGANASTSTFDVANGVVLAYNGGAQVINLSLGSDGDSAVLRDLISTLSAKNIIFFAAKGNEPVTTPFYPAADPHVVPVTALDNGQLASYANRADIPSVGAPGTTVVYYNGQPYYVVGTSVSTSFTSGLAAGLMETTHQSAPTVQQNIVNKMGVK